MIVGRWGGYFRRPPVGVDGAVGPLKSLVGVAGVL